MLHICFCSAGFTRDYQTHSLQAEQHATIMAGIRPDLPDIRGMLQWDSIDGRYCTHTSKACCNSQSGLYLSHILVYQSYE